MKSTFNNVTVDYIARNDATGGYFLYLMEPAGWSDLDARLKALQHRVYTALDVVMDGQLASDYPDSRGKNVQIAVVFGGQEMPVEACALLERLDRIAKQHEEYGPRAIAQGLISAISVCPKIAG